MPTRVTIKNLDGFLLTIIFPVIIIDLINGVILKSGFFGDFSISQYYKFFILSIILFRIAVIDTYSFVKIILFYLIMVLGSALYNVFSIGNYSYLLKDIVKASKIISLPIFLVFFNKVFQNHKVRERFFWQFIKFSFWIIFANLMLGLLGLGYSQYKSDTQNVGYIGFFYSGNELSALMIIVYMFLGFYFWHKNKSIKDYILLTFICVFLAILKSTKTTILGCLIVFSVIPFLSYRFYISKKFIRLFSLSFLLLPLLSVFVFLGLKSSSLTDRFVYYWHRFDVMTFVFSGRNLYAKDNFKVFDSYSTIGKFFGRGETYIRNITGRLSEIDLVDILILYGYVGLMIYLFFLVKIFNFIRKRSKKNKETNIYKFGVFFMIFMFVLANTAGHIFVSGFVPFYLAITLSYIINFETKSFT